MDAFVGAIFSTGFNFAPQGFLPCDGRMLSVSEYQVLYTLIGTTYGGNGVTTFGLPNLLSRVPVGTGQGPGLSNYVLAQTGGVESFTMTAANMPSHTHQQTATVAVGVNNADGTSASPINNFFAVAAGNFAAAYSATGGAASAAGTGPSSTTGFAQLPIDMRSPAQAVNYIICVNGLYPQQP